MRFSRIRSEAPPPGGLFEACQLRNKLRTILHRFLGVVRMGGRNCLKGRCKGLCRCHCRITLIFSGLLNLLNDVVHFTLPLVAAHFKDSFE
jgi:hypothetical protein